SGLHHPDTLAAVSLHIAQVPTVNAAIECVERELERAPASLVIATADALRLAHQLGRARALLRAKGITQHELVADILRRSGDSAAAHAAASSILQRAPDNDGARSCLARIELDAGQPAKALRLVEHHPDARCAEVAALASMRLGHINKARSWASRGAALANTPEQRARLLATTAFVWHGSDAARARAGYREAALHARRAGALVEEASYLTGQAAACVDLGELDSGLAAARRAALLWDDVLRRPQMAARAWLSIAAAFAAVHAHHEARSAAQQAAERARLGGDTRAQGYAALVLADSYPSGDSAGVAAAERASDWLPDGDDKLHAWARQWRHGCGYPSAETLNSIDQRAATATDLSARLAWWSARAERCLRTSKPCPPVLPQLLLLAAQKAPTAALGPAMHWGTALARRSGDSLAVSRLDAVRQRCASRVLQHCGGHLREAASGCVWLQRSGGPTPIEEEQALDLQHLVRALSERTNLQTLLDRVLDMLLLWTRAERGLLLLTDDDHKLQPRAARNLGRDDLSGEQLELSRTLARQAFDSRMPVVAIDAMQELSDSHASVHALKLRSIMALPLIVAGKSLGVVYLDDRARRGAFGDKELRWAQAVAPIAALAITDARAQVALRAAAERAQQDSDKLEQMLARKESALAQAERELAHSQGQRQTRFRYDNIIGHGHAMRRVLHVVDRV
ncbi:MAG TPA: GAF domain-containing protein, partial [Sorangium sp.]|nr:GAF domain-containing protein [Sorangium sp.]